MSNRIRRLAAGLLAALCLLPAHGMAHSMHLQVENPDLHMEMTIGYDGVMTYGKTMPITVRVENNGPDWEGVAAVQTYQTQTQYNRYELEVSLAQGAVKEWTIPVSVYSKQEKYTVELLQDGEVICAVTDSPERVIDPGAAMIGVLSSDAQSLSYMNIAMENDDLLRGEYMQVIELTEKTFPDNRDMLDSFSMLVVDGFDASVLDAQQQEALESWLQDGHILVVGGGANAGASWKAFSHLTGLTPGTIVQSEDITPALLDYLGITGQPSGQEIMLVQASGGTALITHQDTPLVWRAQAGEGMVYTTAFALGEKPVSTWPVMHTFWQRLLLMDCPELYQTAIFFNDHQYENWHHYSQQIPLENDTGMAGMIGLTAAVLLGGCLAAWFILKRLDRRQFMWLALPLVAAACTAMVCVMGHYTQARQPVALSITAIRQDAQGQLHLSKGLTVSASQRGEHRVGVSQGTIKPVQNRYYYDINTDAEAAEPTQLDYRFFIGAEQSVGLQVERAWQSKNMTVENSAAVTGGIESAIWRESDGMHGYVINRTGLPLDEGVVMCGFGYCSVPALQDGERFDFTLRSAEFADPQNPVYEDGCLYESLAGMYADIYTISSEYFYHDSHAENRYSVRHYDPVKDMKHGVLQELLNMDYQEIGLFQSTLFHYVGFSENFPETGVTMDGQPVTRSEDWGVISAVLNYQSIGDTGIFYRMPGMDEAVRCEVDAQGRPYVDETAEPYTAEYHRLKDHPAFVFDLSAWKNVDIEHLTVYTQGSSRQARMYLYDGQAWTEQIPGEQIDNPQRFIDADGRLYVQFRGEVSISEYMEISTPTLLMEGQVR